MRSNTEQWQIGIPYAATRYINHMAVLVPVYPYTSEMKGRLQWNGDAALIKRAGQ